MRNDMMAMSESPVVFEAVIVPHRSLGRRGLRVLALSLAGLSALVAFGLWLAGAWPVIGFTGGEVALAVWLLRRNALAARAMELLLLSDRGLAVVRIDASGRRSERVLASNWLRADLQPRPGRTPALMLRAAGVSIEVAASLGEDEKRSLATELQHALHRQRHPIFDNPQLFDGPQLFDNQKLGPLSPPSAPLI